MKIHLIAGMTRERVIGTPGALPWHIPEDLKHFKEITTGHTVIMGYNTYLTINKPLPNRNNIVLSHEQIEIPGVTVCTSIDDALAKAKEFKTDAYIMGGASVYEQMLPQAEVLHISHIKKDYPGTIHFPEVNWEDWQETASQDFKEFTYKKYERATK